MRELDVKLKMIEAIEKEEFDVYILVAVSKEKSASGVFTSKRGMEKSEVMKIALEEFSQVLERIIEKKVIVVAGVFE